jgi:cell wall-associated NlpC family hydrolase
MAICRNFNCGDFEMERQYAMILFLALGLLLTFKAFAEASTMTRKKTPRHNKSSDQPREPRKRNVTSSAHRVTQGNTLHKSTRPHGMAVRQLKSANHLRSNQLQVRESLILSTPPTFSNRGTKKLQATDSKFAVSVRIETKELSDGTSHTIRGQLVETARNFIGLHYRWGGMSERHGVDCSGLVKLLFAKLHVKLPRSSREQIQSGEEVSMDELEMGDLVFFSSSGRVPTHVGIYMGDNQFLHAARKAGHVIISDLNQPWYTKRFLGARRIVDLSKGEGTT